MQMDTRETIESAVRDLRRQADLLEQLLDASVEELGEVSGLPIFDPDSDEPPVRADVDGTREERDWCGLLLWGQLWALNVRKGRGATHSESVAFAKRAGYKDGRAWNSWDGWRKDADGMRWVNLSQPGGGGLGSLRHYYGAVGRALPADLDEGSTSDV